MADLLDDLLDEPQLRSRIAQLEYELADSRIECSRHTAELQSVTQERDQLRARLTAGGDERIAEQARQWQLELQQLPVFQPRRACLNRAMDRLKEAVREMDGAEHPAVWQLTQTCRWLLAAIESNDERLRIR
jgi:predicted  nucleic acid-binding Zn-ribbon protein